MSDIERLVWHQRRIMADCAEELLRHLGVTIVDPNETTERALCQAVCRVTGSKFRIRQDEVEFFDKEGNAR